MPEVCCGAEWTTSQGNKRYYSETLNDADGREMAGEAWETMSWVEKHAYLEKKADLLVLAYLYREEAITQDVFEHRVQQVKARS